MTCSVCRHEAKAEIEERLARGEPVRAVAKRFPGITKSSADRHRRLCMVVEAMIRERPPATKRKKKTGAEPKPKPPMRRPAEVSRRDDGEQTGEWIDERLHLSQLRERVFEIFDEAERFGDGRLQVSAIRELRQLLELEGRFNGKLQRPEAEDSAPSFFIFPVGSEPIINLGGSRARDRRSALTEETDREAIDITPESEGGD
jgi:hypothetical protein